MRNYFNTIHTRRYKRMGISVREFEVAMSVSGGNPIAPKEDIFYGHPHLRYELGNILFEHSGEECVFLLASTPRAMELLKLAKYQLKGTKGINTHNNSNKIYSVKELLALCLFITDNYSKPEFENSLNLAYEELQKIPVLNKSISNNYRGGILSTKLSQKLYKLIDNFDKAVNPFCGFKRTKKPSVYLENLDVSFDFKNYSAKTTFTLSISGNSSSTDFIFGNNILRYYAEYLTDITGSSYSGYKSVEHKFFSDSKEEYIEIHNYSNSSSKITIFNLTTGVVVFGNESPTPATDEEVKEIITAIAEAINIIKISIDKNILL